ncbi:uncharacterized protein N7500_010253 [Penicillium coprophilum]|uniref:uncharacterized protein n=1 Tax=Penicillium coprophilum TaxID=36646 RepID=UPI0023989E84|nr:uncharacterized protein N7500_010253 [Penicillium coprophilum]KAJ5154814.1 hypothetical protein N7500_010253 [Penicillium coprophilum]
MFPFAYFLSHRVRNTELALQVQSRQWTDYKTYNHSVTCVWNGHNSKLYSKWVSRSSQLVSRSLSPNASEAE